MVRSSKTRDGDQTPLCTLTSRTSVNPLVLQLDFGHLDGDVVSRPLIIKISEHSHRNDKRPDNCYCEWFHQGILQFEFFRPLHSYPCDARPDGARPGGEVEPSTPMVSPPPHDPRRAPCLPPKTSVLGRTSRLRQGGEQEE